MKTPIVETRGRKKRQSRVLDEVTRYRIGGLYKSDLEAAKSNVERYAGRKFSNADEYSKAVDSFRKLIAARATEIIKRS